MGDYRLKPTPPLKREKEMKMNEEKEMIMTRKLEYFLENQIKVHIKQANGFFLNGYVSNKEADTVFHFEDDKLGKVILFAYDVFDVSEFTGSTGSQGVKNGW